MADEGDDLLKRQKEFLDAFFKKGAELAEELQRLGNKLAEVERENHDLASLYVAAHRLHASRAPRDVVQTIVEILLNFVGAKTFGVFAAVDGRLAPVAVENPAGRTLPDPPPVAEAVFPDGGPTDAAPIVIPFVAGAGVIAVWELVGHKTRIEEVDRELFNLLAARAAGLGTLVAP
jgi:hypothetical protein